MKNFFCVVGIFIVVCVVLYMPTDKKNMEIGEEDLEYRIEELEYEIEGLKEEINTLECQLEEAEKDLDNKDEYIEELQQLLEENNIDEWEGINTILTDKEGKTVPPSNNKSIKIKKD